MAKQPRLVHPGFLPLINNEVRHPQCAIASLLSWLLSGTHIVFTPVHDVTKPTTHTRAHTRTPSHIPTQGSEGMRHLLRWLNLFVRANPHKFNFLFSLYRRASSRTAPTEPSQLGRRSRKSAEVHVYRSIDQNLNQEGGCGGIDHMTQLFSDGCFRFTILDRDHRWADMLPPSGPDWMSALPEGLWDVPLTELAIPGTELVRRGSGRRGTPCSVFLTSNTSVELTWSRRKDVA